MRKVKCLFVLLVLLAGASLVQGVTITNFSFEDDGMEIDPGVPTGWTSDSSVDIGVATGGAGVTDGVYRLWMGNGVTLYQTTSTVIGAAGASYTLQVDVKNDWNADPQIIIYYDDAGTRVPLGEAHYLASDFPDSDIWVEAHTLELTVETTTASVGKNLGVELSCFNYPGNVWSHYDNVRLVNNTVILVSPENEEMFVATDADLVWSLAPTVDTIDVYFGLEDDPNLSLIPANKVLTGEPATTLSYSPTMDYGTTYYWKVVGYESGSPTESEVRSFTTAGPEPMIQSMTPYGQSVPDGVGADPTITVSGINLEDFDWYKDSVLLTDTVKYGGLGTDTLTINDAVFADEGIYSCVASNALSAETDTANAVVVTERLISWWKLDGNLDDSVQEVVAGAPEFDGTPAAGVVFTGSGNNGGALDLQIDDPNYPLIPIDGTEEFFNFYEDSFTVTAWVKTAYVSSTAWPAVVSKGPDGVTGYTIALNDSSNVLSEIDNTRIYSSSPTVADDEWHMLGMTYDGSTQKLYMDGQLKNSVAVSAVDASDNVAPVLLGNWNTGSESMEFEGNIDDVKVYSYARTITEIGEEYVALKTGVDYVCNNEIVFDYDFDGDCRVTLTDFAYFADAWLDCSRIPDTTCAD